MYDTREHEDEDDEETENENDEIKVDFTIVNSQKQKDLYSCVNDDGLTSQQSSHGPPPWNICRNMRKYSTTVQPKW